jgi:hypothetical protein
VGRGRARLRGDSRSEDRDRASSPRSLVVDVIVEEEGSEGEAAGLLDAYLDAQRESAEQAAPWRAGGMLTGAGEQASASSSTERPMTAHPHNALPDGARAYFGFHTRDAHSSRAQSGGFRVSSKRRLSGPRASFSFSFRQPSYIREAWRMSDPLSWA